MEVVARLQYPNESELSNVGEFDTHDLKAANGAAQKPISVRIRLGRVDDGL